MNDKPKTPSEWAFMRVFRVHHPDGTLYLWRLRMLQTPWFAIYLHKINTFDKDKDPHDHPWSFVSWLLRGSYTEWRPQTGAVRRRWLSWAFRRSTDVHRITTLDRTPVWTLVFCGRRSRSWGFHTSEGFVPWREYLEREGTREAGNY